MGAIDMVLATFDFDVRQASDAGPVYNKYVLL